MLTAIHLMFFSSRLPVPYLKSLKLKHIIISSRIEDGGIKVHRNVGTLPQNYAAS
jgi:hypothetical protein